jgi:hypothetical protein
MRVNRIGGDTLATRYVAIRLRILRRRWKRFPAVVWLVAACGLITPAAGQSYPSTFPPVVGGANSPVDIPQTNLTPVPQAFPPQSSTGGALFDPYTTGAAAGAYAPAVPGVAPVTPSSQFPGWLPGGQTQAQPNAFGGTFPGAATNAPPPAFGPGNPGFSSPPLGQTGYGQSAYGTQPFGASPTLPPMGFPPEAYPSNAPTTLFPGGLYQGGGMFGGAQGSPMGAFRLMQGPRFQYAWIRGGDGDASLDMSEIDTAVSFAFPNFFHSGQPIYISPVFELDLLRGPNSSTGADLPGQVYAAHLDADWQSDPNQIFSIDLGLSVGMFSDFDTNISDSFRVLGRGVGHFRLTPYTTFKAGAYYINRNKVEVLPAIGWVYTPTPLKRCDIFFPEPKFSHYFSTVGTQDVWLYLGGEYGGGSWTVQRESGQSEQVDINDIRILMGMEWGRSDMIRQGRRTGFVEFGYVFERELVYKNNTADNMSPNDTFMLRAGIGY